MNLRTIAGKTYAVTPAVNCTVTTPEGILIATCPADGQTYFVAPCTEVEVSDDSALVTESFKGALGGSSASGGAGAFRNLTVTGGTVLKGDVTVSGISDLGNVRALNMSMQRADIMGPAYFGHGVTMAQSLNVEGLISGAGGMDLSGSIKHTGGVYIDWRNKTDDDDHIHVCVDAGGVQLCIFRQYFYMGGVDPQPEDVLNVKEMDARYVRLRTDLTAAQYAALEVKDQTTLYITSDDGKIYLGSYALN